MKQLIIGSIVGLVLSIALTVQAAGPQPQAAASVGGKSTAPSPSHVAVNRQAAVSCNICFTCGGDWPIFAGSIRSVGDFPTERSSACSGTLIGRTDSSPFLCCN